MQCRDNTAQNAHSGTVANTKSGKYKCTESNKTAMQLFISCPFIFTCKFKQK